MRYAFNRLRRVALGQILPHVRGDGTIGLEDLPAFIQLLEAAFGDPDRVATAERNMREIKQKNCEFSQYYAEFEVIAANLDWNPSALRNALRMGLSEEMKHSFTNSDTPRRSSRVWDGLSKAGKSNLTTASGEGHIKSNGRDGFRLFPQTPCFPERPRRRPRWKGCWIYRTSAHGSQRWQEKDFGGRESKEVCGWEVFILWWV